MEENDNLDPIPEIEITEIKQETRGGKGKPKSDEMKKKLSETKKKGKHVAGQFQHSNKIPKRKKDQPGGICPVNDDGKPNRHFLDSNLNKDTNLLGVKKSKAPKGITELMNTEQSAKELRSKTVKFLLTTEALFYEDFYLLSPVDRMKVRLSLMDFGLPRLQRVESSEKVEEAPAKIDVIFYDNPTENNVEDLTHKDLEILKLKQELEELKRKLDRDSEK